jgi:transposase
MSNFRPINRDTGFLLPPSVDEWLPQRHLGRFVVEVVDRLDLSALEKAYRGSGSASYHPAMLLALLIYGYATRVFSSRALERATYDSVAVRFIAGNEHPDHDTIATFRKRFLGQIEPLFVESEARAGDGDAQARHGRLGWHQGTCQCEPAQRALPRSCPKARKAAQAGSEAIAAARRATDAADLPDDLSIPEELERREQRLAAIAEAKAKS